eukprot:CAMPEP_0114545986 /NCGR_PEP_ID=MMETSP0114-20121206/3701_1 /TAXON_ID=31324 /ORGANISM="Goniomonas sp, Strain m" /LENGTH=127 /DNA_ID=CAMNT_0001730467 /DNA_START=60 /DNA_END=440 /DNA_ORIENTATION=+
MSEEQPRDNSEEDGDIHQVQIQSDHQYDQYDQVSFSSAMYENSAASAPVASGTGFLWANPIGFDVEGLEAMMERYRRNLLFRVGEVRTDASVQGGDISVGLGGGERRHYPMNVGYLPGTYIQSEGLV